MRFDDLSFGPADPTTNKQTSGSYIAIKDNVARIRATKLTMVEFHEGITVNNVASIGISEFRGFLYSDGVATSSSCLHFNGGLDVRADSIFCQCPFNPTGTFSNATAGIWIEALSDGTFSNMDIIGMGTDLLVNPPAGKEVDSLWVSNSFLDTANRGADLTPAGGAINRARLSNVWASSHKTDGIRVGANTNGVDISFPHLFGNANYGLSITGGSNVAVSGGQIGGNRDNGVFVASGISDWSVIGSTLGATGGFGGNGHFGIYVDTGASDRYRIVDNLMQGNGTAAGPGGAIRDSGTGTHKSIWNNIGFEESYRAYRDDATGFLNIVGQQAEFSGFVFRTDDGTEQFTITSSGITIGGQAVTFGAPNSGGATKRLVLVPN